MFHPPITAHRHEAVAETGVEQDLHSLESGFGDDGDTRKRASREEGFVKAAVGYDWLANFAIEPGRPHAPIPAAS